MKKCAGAIAFLLFFIPIQTKAIICTNENKVKYQNLAKNITTSYTYTENTNGTITFQVKLSNIHEALIIDDVINNKKYSYQGAELVIPNLKQNTSYRFDVYTDRNYCHREVLYTLYVNTPYYNPYYKDEVCKGMETYRLCNKWQYMNLSHEEFVKKVNIAKIEKEEEEQKKQKPKATSMFDHIIDFYLDYYYIILPIFIITGIGMIYYYNKKHDLF